MSSEWPRIEIGQVAKLRSGFPFKSADWKETGVPVIKIANVKGGRIIPDGCGFVSSEVASKSAEWYTRTGDVLIAMTGYVGEVAQAKPGESYLINQRVGRFDFLPKAEVEPTYFFYHLQHPDTRAELEGVARGSAQPNLSAGDAHKIKITLPPLTVQREIAATLSSLDDRIALLRETNTTLEAIAQALFKSWFVDFDPVNAKMQGRAPESMDEATAALFPDSFEDSELGPVPKGWLIGTIDTLARLNPESWSAKQHPDRIHYIDLANTKDGQIDGINEFSFEDAPSRARRVLRYGDVIVGTVRPGNRSFARITTEQPGLTGSTGFAVLRAQEEFDQALVYIAATSDEAIDRLAHLADGGAYPAVRPEVVSSTPLIVAPESIRKAFGEIANTFYLNIGVNQERMRQLSLIRDTLLPRLISGQLQTEEAHQSLQEVES